MSQLTRVLILHADETVRRLVSEAALKIGFEIRFGTDIGDLVEAYNTYRPDTVVADTPLDVLEQMMIVNWLDQVGFTGRLVLISRYSLLMDASKRFDADQRSYEIVNVAADDFPLWGRNYFNCEAVPA